MSRIIILLGQMNALDGLNPDQALGKTGGMLVRDILVIGGALVVLSAILLIWAKNTVRRSKHRHHGSRSESKAARPREATEVSREHRHHGRRRSRREHRERNPTLDKTGGLPPVRDET